jgi:hypothetical protein
VPARDDGRHENVLAGPLPGPFSGFEDTAADLVPEHQRELGHRLDLSTEKPKIGVAEPTPGDFNEHFTGSGCPGCSFDPFEGLARLNEAPGI